MPWQRYKRTITFRHEGEEQIMLCVLDTKYSIMLCYAPFYNKDNLANLNFISRLPWQPPRQRTLIKTL